MRPHQVDAARRYLSLPSGGRFVDTDVDWCWLVVYHSLQQAFATAMPGKVRGKSDEYDRPHPTANSGEKVSCLPLIKSPPAVQFRLLLYRDQVR
jgi:hypothetical protein